MKKIFISLVLTILSITVYAKQIVCTRQYDGGTISYDLNNLAGSYKLTKIEEIESDDSVEVDTLIIAENMDCKFIKFSGYCDNESYNKHNGSDNFSIVKLVDKEEYSLNSLRQTVLQHDSVLSFSYEISSDDSSQEDFYKSNCKIYR